jgi:phage terminase large subunit
MLTPKFKATNVLKQTNNTKSRLIVHQGGARSSKTYSIVQFLLLKAIENPKTKITIARSALTNAKDTVYKDFIDIVSQSGISDWFSAHLTTLTYTLKANGSEIQFIGLEDPLKLHGRKQDYFWFNEANYCTYEDFRQVNSRTTGQIIMDFNPSDLYHWIYEKILPREDCTLIKSTYLDNPFLPKEIVNEIEAARETDPDWFKVYGLGERASSKDLIYPRYEYYNIEPDGCRVMYGLDFGYNHPTALVKCSYRDGELYLREMLYQSHLTTPELISLLSQLVNKRDEIRADGARPEIIEDIRKAGFNIKSAQKEVKHGIDKVKSQKIFVNGENLVKEIQNYKWKRHNATDTVLEEPVKNFDDALDAARYGSYELVSKPLAATRVTLTKMR